MDRCLATALSLTVFHCLIQFPPRHPYQILTCKLVRKIEDQLKRRVGAKGKAAWAKMKRYQMGGSSFYRCSSKQNWRPIYRCASTPLVSCQAAFLMLLHCASLCMPYWTKPIGNQGESNIHWDTFRWRPRRSPVRVMGTHQRQQLLSVYGKQSTDRRFSLAWETWIQRAMGSVGITLQCKWQQF